MHTQFFYVHTNELGHASGVRLPVTHTCVYMHTHICMQIRSNDHPNTRVRTEPHVRGRAHENHHMKNLLCSFINMHSHVCAATWWLIFAHQRYARWCAWPCACDFTLGHIHVYVCPHALYVRLHMYAVAHRSVQMCVNAIVCCSTCSSGQGCPCPFNIKAQRLKKNHVFEKMALYCSGHGS